MFTESGSNVQVLRWGRMAESGGGGFDGVDWSGTGPHPGPQQPKEMLHKK